MGYLIDAVAQDFEVFSSQVTLVWAGEKFKFCEEKIQYHQFQQPWPMVYAITAGKKRSRTELEQHL